MPHPSVESLSRLLLAALAAAFALAASAAWLLMSAGHEAAPGALVPAGYLALALVVAAAALVFAFRLLRRLGGEMGGLTHMLDQMRNAPLVVHPPACQFEETGRLLAVTQRVAEELVARQQALVEASQTDAITGLENRTLFFQQFRHAFELARRGNEICLMLVELEGLTQATDVLGHEAGDALLRILADTLRTHSRKSDIVARLGVHDFAVLYYNAKAGLMRPRLEQLLAGFRAAQEASAHTAHKAHCRLAIGFTALQPATDKQPEDTFLRAQRALRAARGAASDSLRMEMALPPPANAV
jgi:diguanylate cyclase (GGDEF)-like protein